MNPLEKEILKYEKKAFKKVQKRTLKYGTRIFLKKAFRLSGFEGIYLYYVDGNATTNSLHEFFRDYARFYEVEKFGEGDKGFFLYSGSVDEKLFRDLRKVMIDDDDVRISIKLQKLKKSDEVNSERVPDLTHDETERIIRRVGTKCSYPNCKQTVVLDVHHIIPRKEGGTNKDSNLIVLCPYHHRLADGGVLTKDRLEMYSVAKMEDRRL